MKAAILAIGSELLGTERLDTNSLRLTELLERFGIALQCKAVIGDDLDAIAAELRRLAATADLVLVTGGLGPTADDVTRPAAAKAFDRQLSIDEQQVERMRQLFASYGREMADVNRRQAEVLSGSKVLNNPQGTAPGLQIEHDGATIFLFPGVPRELHAMMDAHLQPWLSEHSGNADVVTERAVLKVASLPESEVEQRIAPVYEQFGREDITILSSPGEIRLYVSATGTAEQRQAHLEPRLAALRQHIGSAVFTDREADSLESVVGQLLVAAGKMAGTAESCTGGLIAERLTRVPGSSAFFAGGAVTYSNELKMAMVGVPAELLQQHGAVSEPVAKAMAQGARKHLEVDYAVAVTGIAGPGGGSGAKPVGTVHLALAGPTDDDLKHRLVHLPGDRQRIRQLTSQIALELLRRDLLARQEQA